MTAIAVTDLFAELENLIKAGSPERRIQILRRVTGLFLSDADRLNEHHIGVFDEVLVRLMACADSQTLATLSAAFADVQFMPKGTVRSRCRSRSP